MHLAVAIVSIVAGVGVVAGICNRMRWPTPLVLLVVGVGVSYVPGVPTVRIDPERAAFVGIDVWRQRVFAFTIAGAAASLAGGLAAPWAQIVAPDSVQWLHSAQPMLATPADGTRPAQLCLCQSRHVMDHVAERRGLDEQNIGHDIERPLRAGIRGVKHDRQKQGG